MGLVCPGTLPPTDDGEDEAGCEVGLEVEGSELAAAGIAVMPNPHAKATVAANALFIVLTFPPAGTPTSQSAPCRASIHALSQRGTYSHHVECAIGGGIDTQSGRSI